MPASSSLVRQVATGVAQLPSRAHASIIRFATGDVASVGAPKGAGVVLSIEGDLRAGFSMLGFSLDGDLAADSSFATLDEAREFATASFAIASSAWIDVPAEVLDVHGYARQRFGIDAPEA